MKLEELPEPSLASWKHTSKVMGGLFTSWGPDDWLAKTSNSEETHPGMTAVTPGKQQIIMAVSSSGKAQKFKRHFGYENGSIVGKRRHCIGIKKNTVISGHLHTYK